MPKTLKECLSELMGPEFSDCRARKYADVNVKSQQSDNWPGPHKNVHFWYILENGYAVGFNENPSKGWSFPVVKAPVVETMDVWRRSSITGKMAMLKLPITNAQVDAYEAGTLIQEAFPNLSAPEREFIKSGITPQEWKEHIGEEETVKQTSASCMKIKADNKCECENGAVINPGDEVEYVGHVVGGMVRVKFPDGKTDVAHPNAFECFR